jgi:hypothetical protein
VLNCSYQIIRDDNPVVKRRMPEIRIFPQFPEVTMSGDPMEWAFRAIGLFERLDLRGPGGLHPVWMGCFRLGNFGLLGVTR